MLKLFVAFNAVWYFSYAYGYVWGTCGLPIKPLYSYIFTIVVSFLLLLVYRQPLIPRGRAASLAAWACVFMLYQIFSFVFISDTGEEALQGLISSSEVLVLVIVFLT